MLPRGKSPVFVQPTKQSVYNTQWWLLSPWFLWAPAVACLCTGPYCQAASFIPVAGRKMKPLNFGWYYFTYYKAATWGKWQHCCWLQWQQEYQCSPRESPTDWPPQSHPGISDKNVAGNGKDLLAFFLNHRQGWGLLCTGKLSYFLKKEMQ